MVGNIIYYAVLAFCIYFINSGGWRRHVFNISKEAYEELKSIKVMFFPKHYQRWKEKWLMPAKIIWLHNAVFTGISQLIGIISYLKIFTKNQSFNLYYLIPLIFITVLPTIIVILGILARKFILEEMIEYLERRSRK